MQFQCCAPMCDVFGATVRLALVQLSWPDHQLCWINELIISGIIVQCLCSHFNYFFDGYIEDVGIFLPLGGHLFPYNEIIKMMMTMTMSMTMAMLLTSSSCIFDAIMQRNSVNSITPLPSSSNLLIKSCRFFGS